jgi:hypothetical protein
MAIEQAVEAEISELHHFFEAWLTGQAANTAEAFQRAEQVMAADFTIVTPAGQELNREALVAGIRAEWGGRPGVRIWAESIRVLAHHAPLVIASYEERQRLDGRETRRLSTAILREVSAAPHGLEWVRVHETWIQDE